MGRPDLSLCSASTKDASATSAALQPRKRGRPQKGTVRNSDGQQPKGHTLADLRRRLGVLLDRAESKGKVDEVVKLTAELRNLELAGLKVAPEAGRENALQQFSDGELRAELDRRGLATMIHVTFQETNAD